MNARDWELWSTACRLVVTDPAALAVCRGARRRRARTRRAGLQPLPSRQRADDPRPRRDGCGRAEPAARRAGAAPPCWPPARPTAPSTRPSAACWPGSATTGTSPRCASGDRATRRRAASSRAGASLALDGRRLRMPAGTQLDLGATAKAVAADRCARLVHDAARHRRAGQPRRRHRHRRGATPVGGWQVRVQDLPDDVPQQITLHDGAAVATSSSARAPGPRTGSRGTTSSTRRPGCRPTGPWRSVTVVAPTCLRANTATTAAMVKGDAALAWLRSTGPPGPTRLARGRPGHPGRLAAGGGGMNEALWALGRGHRRGRAADVHRSPSCSASCPARDVRSAGLGRFGLAELHRTAALTGVGLIAVHLTLAVLRPLRPAASSSTSWCRSSAATARSGSASAPSRSTCCW